MNESELHLVLEYNEGHAKDLWPNTLYSLLCLVIGLLGNGYVLLVYKFKMDTTESRYFIPHLAIADALACLFTCISFILLNFHYIYFPWNYFCKIVNYISGVPGLVSALLLTAIAVQRFTKIRPSMRYYSLSWRRATVACFWIGSAIVGIPGFIYAGVGEIDIVYKGVNITSMNCQTRNHQYPIPEKNYFLFLVVVFVLNLVIMVTLYIAIAVVLYGKYRQKSTAMRCFKAKRSSAISEKEGIGEIQETEFDSIEHLGSDIKATNACSSTPAKKPLKDSNVVTTRIERIPYNASPLTIEESQGSGLDSIAPLASNVQPTKACDSSPVKIPMDNSNEITNRDDAKSKTASPSTNFNIIFGVIVGLYVLAFLPAGIMVIIILMRNESEAEYRLSLPVWKLAIESILERSWVINNIANPFVYGYFDVEFRNHLKNNLLSFCRRKV